MMNEGQRFGDFEILGRLGASGTGTVYRARQVSGDRLVALKTLHAALATDPEYMARFFRDAKIATELSHPDIVQVLAAGETDGVHWLATEYVEGTTAQARLKRKGRLALPEALAIATHVATVLDYGWRTARLIHRDVEPDTIFLSKKSEVKLRGLGLAKSAGEMQTIRMNGSPMGAPHYMSPEQAEGKRDTDLRTDIYSLGCTLFHFISGVPPYEGDTAMAVILRHVTAPVPELRRVCADCPAEISRVVMKMMHKQPAGRHQNYAELIVDLRLCYEALTSVPAATAVVTPVATPVVTPVVTAAPKLTADGRQDCRPHVVVAAAPKAAPVLVAVMPGAPRVKAVPVRENASERKLSPDEEDGGDGTPAVGKRRSLKKPLAIAAAVLLIATGALFHFLPRKEQLSEAERAELQRAVQKGAGNPAGSSAATDVTKTASSSPPRAPATPAPAKPTPAKIASTTPAPETTAPAKIASAIPAPEPATPVPAPEPAPPPGTPMPAPAAAQSATAKWLAEQEPPWQETFAREVTGPFMKGVGDLKQQYVAAVEIQLASVTKAAQLDAAVAFRAERARLTGGGVVPAEDESMAPAALKTLRAGYRTTMAKLDTERATKAKGIHARYDALLAQTQAALTQRQRLDEALEIKARREALASEWMQPIASATSAPAEAPAAPATPATTKPAPGPTTVAAPRSKAPKLKPGEVVARLLSMGATVSIGQPGSLRKVEKMADLPGEKFAIMKVEINPRDGITEADLDVIEQLDETEEIQLTGVPATDATVKMLRALPSLRVLGLKDLANLTGASFRTVAAMPALKSLAVRGPISTESLAGLAVNRKLDTLALNTGAFSEQDFGAIATIPALKTLTISTSEPVPPAAWARLVVAKKLTSLTAEKTSVNAEVLAQIGRFSELTSLTLGDIAMSDAELAPLGALKLLQTLKTGRGSTFDGTFLTTWPLHPRMKTLTLYSTHTVSDKVLRVIATAFPKLEKLEVTASAGSVTAAGLAHLAKLRQLDYLSLNGDAVDSAGLAHVANCIQLTHLSIGNARATEAEVHLLAKISTLRELEWLNPPATDAALKSYRKLRWLTQFKIGTAMKQDIEDKLSVALPTVKFIR